MLRMFLSTVEELWIVLWIGASTRPTSCKNAMNLSSTGFARALPAGKKQQGSGQHSIQLDLAWHPGILAYLCAGIVEWLPTL